MPTPLLNKLSETLGIPLPELEEKWEKAKSIAGQKFKPTDKSFWPYTHGIFNNMLGLSTSASLPAWWTNMTRKMQQEYAHLHQNSPLVRHVGEGVKKVARVGKRAARTALRVSKGYTNHTIIAAHRTYSKIKRNIAVKLGQHKHGLIAIHKLMMGYDLNPREKARAKNTCKLAGKLLLGGLVAGVAAFAGITAFQAVLGKEYYSSIRGAFTPVSSSFSSVSADDTAGQAKALVKDMYEWLMSQDPKELENRLKEKYGDMAKETK
jgi:hypothetical protein